MKKENLKNDKGVEIIARHLVAMEGRLDKKIDEKFNEVSKKMDDIDFKLEKVTFSHGRRIEVLEDDMIKLKKLTHKK